MGDKLIMSKKERLRKAVFEQVRAGYISQVDAHKRLGISYRQTKRSFQRYLNEGDAGLVHKSRGKTSGRAYPQEFKDAALALYETKYEGFGPTLASEKLAEDDGYIIHEETLRLWLKAAGIWQPHRKRKQHRQRRLRKPRFGELLQLDGSIHPWFEGIEQKQCLMNMVDDATGITLSLLDSGETTYAALLLLKQWIMQYGIPAAVYVDLKSLYVSPKSLSQGEDDELVDSEWLTHFSRACKQLGIEVIKAYSPQAKGRVERSHGVYQDRFVKELKLKNITTIEQANEVLSNGFIEKLNSKFAKPPSNPRDAHIPLMPDDNLDSVLCWEYVRQVKNDWTIQFNNQHYQIEKTQYPVVKPKDKIYVRKHLNGEITMWYKESLLPFHAIDARPVKVEKKSKKSGVSMSEITRRNSQNSPWRRFNPSWLNKDTDTRHANC